MSTKKARWRVFGPFGKTRSYIVENENAIMPQLTGVWFSSRAWARKYRRALEQDGIRNAHRVWKAYMNEVDRMAGCP